MSTESALGLLIFAGCMAAIFVPLVLAVYRPLDGAGKKLPKESEF